MTKTLPLICYAKHPVTDKIVVLRAGSLGSFERPNLTDSAMRELNDLLGVTEQDEEIMLAGSMFGWDTPIVRAHFHTPTLIGTEEAQKIAAQWVATFGLGFHPDTTGEDYVNADGTRSLTDAEAVAYDADMARLFDLPGDPYAVALEAMRKAGLNVY